MAPSALQIILALVALLVANASALPARSTSSSSDDTSTTSYSSGVRVTAIVIYVVVILIGLLIHIVVIYLIYVKLACGHISKHTLRHPRIAKAEKNARPGDVVVQSRYQVADRWQEADAKKWDTGREREVSPGPAHHELDGGAPRPYGGHVEMRAPDSEPLMGKQTPWRKLKNNLAKP